LDDTDRSYVALLRSVETLRTQLTMTALSDPARDMLYRDLLGCYHELFALYRCRLADYRVRRVRSQTD
jgi:hypothetical protein